MKHPANSIGKYDERGHNINEGQLGRIRIIKIAVGRISRKVRAKEIGFISRRTTYKTIRVNKWRKVEVQKLLKLFWIGTRNIFQGKKS